MGLGCVKTRRRGKLIERISFQIAISATRNFSARSILSRSEKAILLVLECAGFSHGQGQKRPKLPWLPAAKSSTEQTVNFVPKAVIPGRWQSASAAVAVPVMRHSRANATTLIVIVSSFVLRPDPLVPAARSLAVPPMPDQAPACERPSHSSKPMRPRRASPNGTSECSSTRPPQYPASGSLTTSRGSPTAFR